MPIALPAVRASAVRDTLAFLDRFEPGSKDKVLARVPPASREVIDTTPRSYWISIEHDHHTVDAMIELFGVQRATQCWRRSVADLVNRPLLKSFASGIMRLFADDPGQFISVAHKAWPLIYQAMCTTRMVERSHERLVLRFDEVAPAVRQYDNYFRCWHGACLGMCDLIQAKADVDFTISRDKQHAEALFVWR